MENFQQKYVEKRSSIPDPAWVDGAQASVCSPFDGVKLELVLALIVGLMMAVGGFLIVEAGLTFTLLLGGYATAAAIWLVWRTRRILNREVAGSHRARNADEYC